MHAIVRLAVDVLLVTSTLCAFATSNLNVTAPDNLQSNGSYVTADVIAATTFVTSSSTDLHGKTNVVQPVKCRINTMDQSVQRNLQQLLEERATLIEYRLTFANYSENPLKSPDVITAYNADRWSRVTTSHGQTLLSLAFNYGVLSMMTLTFGTTTLDVELTDWPPGCMSAVDENSRLESVQYLLMRDFNVDGPIMAIDEARVCHEALVNMSGSGGFRHNCCFLNSVSGQIECTTDIGNIWLRLLYGLLASVRFALFFFGPVLFISAVCGLSKGNVPYVVKLKDNLFKTTVFCTTDTELPANLRAKRVLDLRPAKGFQKLKDAIRTVSLGKPVKVCFSQYDISVDYKRTLTENAVDVGLFHAIFRSIFKCRIRNVGPFRQCCKSSITYSHGSCCGKKPESCCCGTTSGCTGCRSSSPSPTKSRFHSSVFSSCPSFTGMPWITCCQGFSSILLVLLLPFPYYIRLAVFYGFEYDELIDRKRAIAAAGLTETFENSLLHFLLPTHWVFLTIYAIYVAMAVALFVASRDKQSSENRIKKILVGSFSDLNKLAWTDTISMAVANFIWPFRYFGLTVGLLVGLIYWPIALPLTAIVSMVYFLPTVYLTVRLLFYSKSAVFEKARKRKKNRPYQVSTRRDEDMFRFQTDNILILNRTMDDFEADLGIADNDDEVALGLDDVDYIKPAEQLRRAVKDNISLASSIIKYQTTNWRRLIEYTLSALLCIAALYSIVIILSEVVGCLVEVAVFTIMGIIVNAGALLKYVMLVMMVFVYCCDCFNNVEKKYLKLNKALFNEVKSRIKDLADVTSLPSFLQENRGFKSQELGEQADYESPDDVADRPARHWMINDLVLFVDSEDTPRIPRQLFEEVCEIRVAGVPGPVFRGHIEALTQLAKIVLFIGFVFLIVLSFGAVYKVSTTNQMLATMVGGFLPLVLKTFLAPPAPEVELGTVSFKSKMDEVIKNFCQYWPIYDLPFDVVKPEDESGSRNGNEISRDLATVSVDRHASPSSEADQESLKPEGFVPNQGLSISSCQLNICNFTMLRSSPGLQPKKSKVYPQDTDSSNDGSTANGVQGHGNLKRGKEKDKPNQQLAAAETSGKNLLDSADIESATFGEGVDGTRSQPPEYSRGVKMVRVEEPTYEDVDLLVYLPDKYDGQPWLDEWSDIVSIKSVKSRISVFMMPTAVGPPVQ